MRTGHVKKFKAMDIVYFFHEPSLAQILSQNHL